MAATIAVIGSTGATRRAPLASWLDPHRAEAARNEALAWIKRLRLVPYGAESMRDRFVYGDDSLWWFTEIYLHRMRRLETAVAMVAALDTIVASESPARLDVDTADVAAAAAARAFSRARGIRVDVSGTPRETSGAWKSYLVGLSARLSRLRPAGSPSMKKSPAVAAFVHTAFWRPATDADGPQQESYIGPVLQAVGAQLAAGDLVCVGVGPRRNFRARKWWDPVSAPDAGRPHVVPIERLAQSRALEGSRALWRRRDELARAVTSGDAIHDAAHVAGVDLWDVLRPELEATARLQWTWSARAIDEAGAALDALQPGVAVTYAEAGGWGRALVLAARRRGIPVAGVQHGFIYRHWLNYRHEADEIAASTRTRGFPLPDRTLLFDRYAETYLATEGRFPAGTTSVTGNARLDDVVAQGRLLSAGDRERTRASLDSGSARLVLFAAKYREAAEVLPALVEATRARDDLRLVIKTHPAETPDVYRGVLAGHPRATVVPADRPLAPLLAVADVLATMNSTVAIDALALGVPALVIGMPNNLSPFVDAGVMAGANTADDIGRALARLLYDREAAARQRAAAAAFVEQYGIAGDGRSAERAAAILLELARRTPAHHTPGSSVGD